MIILDGKATSAKLTEELKPLCKNKNMKLAVVLVGDNDASLIYVNMKKRKCEELGIKCEILKFNNDITDYRLLQEIFMLNNDTNVIGILIQLPLPKHISTRLILDSVDISKDVDGLNSRNLTKILLNEDNVIIPCTPKGIFMLLDEYNISIQGKTITIVGFSDVVGKPLATMCINKGATVTVCHKMTRSLIDSTKNADIIMTATGVPKLITSNMVKENAIVIDIGISRINGKVVGDVDFENVKNKCSYITPVPGGVGTMTIVSLIFNLLLLDKLNNEK